MNAQDIVAQVAIETGLPIEIIVGDTRIPPAVLARRLVYQRMKSEGYSLSKIGKLMQRHHTTILHSLRVDVGGKS